MDNVIEKVNKLIDSTKTLFIASIDEQGFPNMKAMLMPRKRNGLNTFWQSGDTMYCKGGKTDPDYCVLKFTAKSGRYYSNFKSVSFEIEQ
ncbi:MAG: pyridoxamine 5'-phosphate oxidase family protein [Campylobacteraceae bacterium]|jgi:general stress protein 26|nr:pyridoxamine 5'-phosphate oxidase family protein [Campylobacteraceae bacterium]